MTIQISGLPHIVELQISAIANNPGWHAMGFTAFNPSYLLA
jgi:hypothetical protein